ncbi:hypothetical protein CYMTET_35004 [Cymbomonas tetramitiformis]|uniref:Uncharacterized protein n=1 Tax=Cymbomonas tetramitiformis TaxID=36881 RepID=A0AAE0FA54_9CHLO|nr:hypothetical protein CYMTET_35004 [Cymbomonas tetramitiformis]
MLFAISDRLTEAGAMENTGVVIRMQLADDGAFDGSPNEIFIEGLNRPSGMAFGPDGDLYITTFTNPSGRRRVLRFGGPEHTDRRGLAATDLARDCMVMNGVRRVD